MIKAERSPNKRAAKIGILLLLISALSCDCFSQTAPDVLWKTNVQSHYVSAIAFSPDSRTLASASDNPVWLWNSTNGSLIRSFLFRDETVCSLTFSTAGTKLVAGGECSTIKIWEVSTGTGAYVAYGSDPCRVSVVSLSFSADDTLLLAGTLYLPLLQRFSDRTVLASFDNAVPASSAAFAPGGQIWLSAGANVVKFWPTNNPYVQDKDFIYGYSDYTSEIKAAAFHPDGVRFITAESNGKLTIRQITNGLIERVIQDTKVPIALAVAPDGQTFLTASTLHPLNPDPTSSIRYWRVSDGALLQSYDDNVAGVLCLTIAPNGKYFAYGRSPGEVAVACMPLWITATLQNGSESIIRWQGGSGNYQVQKCEDLSAPDWVNVGGPTTETSATNTVSDTTFFRVQSVR